MQNNANTYHKHASLEPFGESVVHLHAELSVMRYLHVSEGVYDLLSVRFVLDLRRDDIRQHEDEHTAWGKCLVCHGLRVRK